jgi:hypothetical protein
MAQSQFGIAATINDRDEVVGYDQASSSSPRIPWTWRSKTFTYLPFLPGTSSCTAIGLNRDGVAAGACGPFAVLWRRFSVADLNTMIRRNSGWRLVVATSINSHGVIVGDGYYGGLFQAFMLVPATQAVP